MLPMMANNTIIFTIVQNRFFPFLSFSKLTTRFSRSLSVFSALASHPLYLVIPGHRSNVFFRLLDNHRTEWNNFFFRLACHMKDIRIRFFCILHKVILGNTVKRSPLVFYPCRFQDCLTMIALIRSSKSITYEDILTMALWTAIV